MKHSIDPKIDCVFKALFGSKENSNLLIHFINAVLFKELKRPIKSVEILNPYNEKEFIGDKLSIVDVKATDSSHHIYQIEIQFNNFNYLSSRMLYNWADIYSKQIKEGDKYYLLKPTYSIWILNENMIKDDNYAHNYKFRDQKGQLLNQHGGIWLLELSKFNIQSIQQNEHRWLKFLKEGDKLDDELLPNWMLTDEMRQAMDTLRVFSEKEHQYERYRARQEYLRVQNSIQFELESAAQEKDMAIQEKDMAIQEKDMAIQEKDVAIQEKDVAIQEKDVAIQEKDVAIQENGIAIQKKEEEIAYLKSLLAQQSI